MRLRNASRVMRRRVPTSEIRLTISTVVNVLIQTPAPMASIPAGGYLTAPAARTNVSLLFLRRLSDRAHGIKIGINSSRSRRVHGEPSVARAPGWDLNPQPTDYFRCSDLLSYRPDGQTLREGSDDSIGSGVGACSSTVLEALVRRYRYVCPQRAMSDEQRVRNSRAARCATQRFRHRGCVRVDADDERFWVHTRHRK